MLLKKISALILALGFTAICAYPLRAADPLHVRIDTFIENKAKAESIPIAGTASDAEFLRRVYLDFAGTLPTVAEAKAFFIDPATDKRLKQIDKLLGATTYAARMADQFDVMFMERLGENADWSNYLIGSFNKNKPYNQMIQEILRADSKDTANVGSAFWISKRLEHYGQQPVDYPALTRDVGRLFLGKNLQCAECHDHLFIDDYKQQDFQGLSAFLKNAYLVDAEKMIVAEKPTTEKTSFTSVFTRVEKATGPALPGLMMVEIPMFPKGMEFLVPPDKKTKEPGVPKFRTLVALSEQLPVASNKDFARNAVNRLWFGLMGVGLVHPLDLYHSRNVGSHPQLLELLATEFAAHNFDIKWFLRELALTKTYQRSSLTPVGIEPPETRYFTLAAEKRLSTDQLLTAVLAATGADSKIAPTLRPKFLKAFANQPREPEDEIAPSLRSALFLLHDTAVLDLVKPKPGNLIERVAKLDDQAAIDELFLAILCREPTAEERKVTSALLSKHKAQKSETIGRLAWSLLASMEFGVNH